MTSETDAAGAIQFRGKWVRIGEAWHDEELPSETLSRLDLIQHFQRREPMPGAENERFETLVLDLRLPADGIFAGFHTTTRYEIRRAEKRDRSVFACWERPDAGQIRDFRDFFARFAAFRGLDGTPGGPRLEAYSRSGRLWLSRVSDSEAQTLTWHAYVVTGNRARLLYSASARGEQGAERRALIGRGNKFHHWQDMLWLKRKGLDVFDWGGWYAGGSDPVRLNINTFKEKFGGTRESSYHCTRPLTWAGHAYCRARSARAWWAAWRQARAAAALPDSPDGQAEQDSSQGAPRPANDGLVQPGNAGGTDE